MTVEDALRARVAELEAALAALLADGQDYAADAMRTYHDRDAKTESGREAWARRRARTAAWHVLHGTRQEEDSHGGDQPDRGRRA